MKTPTDYFILGVEKIWWLFAQLYENFHWFFYFGSIAMLWVDFKNEFVLLLPIFIFIYLVTYRFEAYFCNYKKTCATKR